MQRRRFLSSLAASGCLATSSTGFAASPERSAARLLTEAAQSAIDRGLNYLAKRQGDNGAFAGSGYSRNVAVCSLAGLAFLSAGSTPGRGPYGKALRRALEYVQKNAQENGFICYEAATSHGPMYDHGFGTLLLAEAYGMAPDDALRERVARAVKLIVATQNKEGGWRYEPRPIEADLSVTVSQIMALRAARNSGIFVPNDTIEKCIDYVKRSQNADGGFMYTLQGGPSRFPRSAAGLVALYSAGIYEGDEIKRGLEYVEKHLPTENDPNRDTHYLYGHYYAVQAMWHAGGEHWEKWYPAIRDTLVTQQSRDGVWQDPISNEYGTAMACIILQMPNNYLPIFER
jgi:prenyltransferase beta subunit